VIRDTGARRHSDEMTNVPKVSASGVRELGRQAARASLFAPAVAFCCAWLAQHRSDPGHQSAAQILMVLSWSLVAFGVVAAVFALGRMRVEGRKGILLQAATGLLVNVAIVALIVGFWVRVSQGWSPPVERDWQAYSPADARFSVLFPGRPREDVESNGRIEQHRLNIKQADGTWFGIDWIEIPGGIKPDEINEFLEGQTAHFGSNGTLMEKQAIAQGRHPGMRSTWRTPTGALIDRRTYVADGRTITAMTGVASEHAQARAADIDRFFSSFKLAN
jgi:hypothetical protein